MFKKKLKSKKGLTLTEMIMALAVFALLSAGVASGIANALPVYKDSVAFSESQLLSSTLTQAICDELRYAKDIKTDVDGKLDTYTSALYGKNAKIGKNSDGKITVGGNPIVGSGTYTNLSAETNIAYDDGTFSIKIIISQGGTEYDTSEFTLSALNK